MSARVSALLALCMAVGGAHAAISVSSTFFGGAPTSASWIAANGVASACAPPKPFPGTAPIANGRVQQHAFYNAGPARCVTVSYSNPACGGSVAFAAYAGAVNFADLSQGYLGDAGGSGASGSFAFVAPSNSTVVLVASEVGGNGAAGSCSYTLGSSELGGVGMEPGVAPIPALTSWTLAVLSGLMGWVMWQHRRRQG